MVGVGVGKDVGALSQSLFLHTHPPCQLPTLS